MSAFGRFSDSEPTFSPKEQEAILMLASRLQGQASQECTQYQLEKVAAESGIDPVYVREAILQLGGNGVVPMPSTASLDRTAVFRALGTIALFIPMQMSLTRYILTSWSREPGLALGITMAIAAGLLMPRGRQWRIASTILALAGSSLAYVVFNLSHAWFLIGGYNKGSLFVLVLLQGLCAFLAHYLADAPQRSRIRRLIG